MSNAQAVHGMEYVFKDALRTHWTLFMFQCVVMLILGIFAVAAPSVATIAVDVYIGWLFLSRYRRTHCHVLGTRCLGFLVDSAHGSSLDGSWHFVESGNPLKVRRRSRQC